MSAPVVVPFDFNPESSIVYTGSYTVPAGKYAIVTAQVHNGGAFTIDGVTALDSDQNLVDGITNITGSTGKTVAFTVSGDAIWEIDLFYRNVVVGSSIDIISRRDGDTNYEHVLVSSSVTETGELRGIKLIQGDQIVADLSNTSDSARLRIAGVNLAAGNDSVTGKFEVSAGTALNVSGVSGNARYTVALYNEVT